MFATGNNTNYIDNIEIEKTHKNKHPCLSVESNKQTQG